MEQTQTEQDERRKAAEKQLREDYRVTFGTDAGKRVLGDLMRRFHVGTTVQTFNPQEMSFWIGQRDTVLFILYMMRTPIQAEKFIHTHYDVQPEL